MFMKKNKHIWELVGKHYSYVTECFLMFEKFVSDFLGGKSAEECDEDFQMIFDLEAAADKTRRELVDAFLDGALLPATRSEILNIVSGTDKIANLCEDIAKQLVIELVLLPEFLNEGLFEIISITKAQIELLSKVIDLLFGNYDQLIKDKSLLRELHKSESRVDKVEIELIKAVYASRLALAEKNHCKYFISKFANISDLIEDIGDEIQVMLVFRKV